MTLTKKQIEAKQAATPSGWRYDWRYAVTRGDHTAIKTIDVNGDGSEIIEARAYYADRYDWRTNTSTLTPSLSVSIYKRSPSNPGIYTSHGLGAQKPIGEAQKTKNYKTLCKFAETVTVEEIYRMSGIAQINESRTLFDSIGA